MVWRQCDNPNYALNHPQPSPSGNFQGEPVMTGAQYRARKGWQTRRLNDAMRKDKQQHFSAGHMKSVRSYMPYIRKCRDANKPPRNVPKKVLQTIVALRLA